MISNSSLPSSSTNEIRQPIKVKRSSSDSTIQKLQEMLGSKNKETQSLIHRITKPLNDTSNRALSLGSPKVASSTTSKETSSRLNNPNTTLRQTTNQSDRYSPESEDGNICNLISDCFHSCLTLQGRSGLNTAGYPDYSYLEVRTN